MASGRRVRIRVVRSLPSQAQVFQYGSFRLGIQGRGGLVQDQQPRLLQQRTGDAERLPLTAGELHSQRRQHCVVTEREAHDEVMGVGQPGRSDHTFQHCSRLG